jgi:hypothetical protein
MVKTMATSSSAPSFHREAGGPRGPVSRGSCSLEVVGYGLREGRFPTGLHFLLPTGRFALPVGIFCRRALYPRNLPPIFSGPRYGARCLGSNLAEVARVRCGSAVPMLGRAREIDFGASRARETLVPLRTNLFGAAIGGAWTKNSAERPVIMLDWSHKVSNRRPGGELANS